MSRNMSKTSRSALAAALVIGITAAGPAEAIVIVGSPITESTSGNPGGPIDDFVWDFSGLPGGTGTASLTLNYENLDTNSTDPLNEYLDVLVDGVLIGDTASIVQTCVGGVEVTLGVTFASDCDGSMSFSFDTALIADGALKVVVTDANPQNPVNALIDRTSGPGFAEITIEYLEDGTVPAPATLALLGLGLAGFGYSRRRTT